MDRTLEQLFGCEVGDPDDAPTSMVGNIWRSWKKPISDLTPEELGSLVVQRDGFPIVLDLVMPKLRADPLFDGGYYPGDVLSNLLRSPPEIWIDRPEYEAELAALEELALAAGEDTNHAFRKSLARF